jgi:diguanylate cyclase (GGDEF)-like protein
MLQLDSHETVAGPDVWLGRVHAEDRVALEAKISSHIAGTSPDLQHEYRIRRSDDTYIWVHCRGAAVRGPKGAAYRLAGSQADITARKRAEEQLVFDAFHDALTGLPNRLLFLDRLGQVLRSFRRGDETWAVLFLDLDRFKVVNDSLGHATGDRLLGKVGGRLLQCVRPSDTVARLGGDEFGILLPEVGALADAIQVADRIETELRRSFTIDGNEVFATASIGIALRSDRYEKAEQVLRDADIAMYQAKAKSKARNSGRYEVFNAEMHGSVLERLALEAHLRRAVEHGQEEFFLEYQPIIDLANGDVIAFEALARWNLPAIGTVPPREFIALAEESGMIAQLGDWILRSAAEQLGLWLPHRGAFERVGISLNMSAHLFREADIVERIAGILAAADVAAERIVVEVTESILLDDADAAVQKLTALRDMGMQIHVDDFGTGYSSLSYLQRFPVTGVKIDRSLVSALVDRPESEALVRAILSLSETLRLTVVAEGIETAAQYARLRELGCAQGQGFHIGMPMAPQQALAWTLSRLRAEAPI